MRPAASVRHLVDKGAGAARAHAVHALLQPAGEVDDLRVFAAKLDGYIRLRRGLLQSGRHRDDLLHEGDAQRLAEIERAGAGDARREHTGTGDGASFLQKRGQGLLRVGHVAAVFLIDGPVLFVQHHKLDRGGADIDARFVCLHVLTLVLSNNVSYNVEKQYTTKL